MREREIEKERERMYSWNFAITFSSKEFHLIKGILKKEFFFNKLHR